MIYLDTEDRVDIAGAVLGPQPVAQGRLDVPEVAAALRKAGID